MAHAQYIWQWFLFWLGLVQMIAFISWQHYFMTQRIALFGLLVSAGEETCSESYIAESSWRR